MFKSYNASTSPWHSAALRNTDSNKGSASNSRSRYNDWAHDDDVENTNEQIKTTNIDDNSRENPFIESRNTHSLFSWSLGDDTNNINLFSHELPETRSIPFRPPAVSSPLSQPSFNSPNYNNPISQPPISQPPISRPQTLVETPIPPPLPTHVSISVPNETLPRAYPVNPTSLYNGSYYSYKGDIYTHKGHHDTLGDIEYLTIRDVLRYVTLGKVVCDSYIDELTRVVTDNIPEHITIERKETTFNGIVYIREIPVFSREHYGIIAKCCIEWALSNPEKLGQD
tara:strand:+ start:543 stop:1391 length:849 start_codon:yes stop_codon:yes gene_type:complete